MLGCREISYSMIIYTRGLCTLLVLLRWAHARASIRGTSDGKMPTFLLFHRKEGVVRIILDSKMMDDIKTKWEDRKIGYVDKDGNWLFGGAIFESAKEFEGEYAKVMTNGKWGIIDSYGKFVIEAEYSFIGDIDIEHTIAGKDHELFSINLEDGYPTPLANDWSGLTISDEYSTATIDGQEVWINRKGEISMMKPNDLYL